MPGTVLTRHVYFLINQHHFYLHFTNEEIEVLRSKGLPHDYYVATLV